MMSKMKDLIQEGRNIQETFKRNVLTEAITPEYAKQVKKEYDLLASKAGKIGKFEFTPVKKGNSQWEAKTDDKKADMIVYFAPFAHPERGDLQSKFEVSVWLMWPNEQQIQHRFGGGSKTETKFIKSISPSKDPKKDAALAFDYIKKFLTSTDITNTLRNTDAGGGWIPANKKMGI